MTVRNTRPPSAVVNAMFCSSLVAAQFVAGKAARDALFLARLEVTSLPVMLIATAVVSIAFVAASSRGMSRFSPVQFVPLLFTASAALFFAEWLLTPAAPKFSAVLVYFHVSALGPILGSGFWLIVTESFDPRTAKQRFGQIAGAGTLGGLAGGLLAERTGVLFGITAVLPFLAVLNIMELGARGASPERPSVRKDPGSRCFAPRIWSAKHRVPDCACSPRCPTCAISRRWSCSAR